MVRRFTFAAAFSLLSIGLPAQDLFDQTKVRDFHLTFKQANWLNTLLATRASGADIKADLRVDGLTYTDVGIRVKASSSGSVNSNKRPFNLTTDAFKPGQSLYGWETLNLNNAAYDPTMTRETISYEIFRDFLPTPRTNYIRVHLNNTFWGVYLLIEQPNKDMLRTWFQDVSGTRYKGDRPGRAAVNTSPLTYRGNTSASYSASYENKTPTHKNSWTDLINMIDKLNRLPNATFKKEIIKVLNVDRALWYLACNNAVINSDDYMGAGHNYFMYFDPMNGQMNMLPWDCNEAFGVHGPSNNTHLYSTVQGSTSVSRPLTRRLLAVPEWRELYFAHYRTVLNRWMDWNKVLGPLNQKFQDRIRADVAKEPYFLFNLARFNPSFSGRFFFNGHWIRGLKEVTIARTGYLRTIGDLTKAEPQFADIRVTSKSVRQGQKIQVTVKITGNPAIRTAVLRSTTSGLYVDNPLFDDGKHGDGKAGDGIYGGTFTAGRPGLPTRFYIHATNTAGTVQVHPEGAEHRFFSVRVDFPQPTSDLVINEFVADNETGDRDKAGDTDDWVELHNRGNKPFDASGCYLSDTALAPKKFKIPANSVVPAGGYLRIWCDDEPGEGPYHANFRLRKSGESVILTDNDARKNKLLDAVVFVRQRADRAYGRVPDGNGEFFYVWKPSGNAPVTGTGLGQTVRFDKRRTGAPSGGDLLAVGTPRTGLIVALNINKGPANGRAIIGLSLGVKPFDLGALGPLILDTTTLLTVPVTLDATGAGGFSATLPANAAGVTVYVQGATSELTNALAMRISK